MNKTSEKITVNLLSFKTLYYLLFTIFVSAFGAYRAKGLFIDWKSIDIGLSYLLGLMFIFVLFGAYFAYINNFIEKLIIGVVRPYNKDSQLINTNISYICLILLSFLCRFLDNNLTGKGAGTIPNIISSNKIRILADIGSGFIITLVCLGIISSLATILRLSNRNKPSAKTVLPFILIAIVSNVLAVYYVTSSKVIFYWDNLGYWTISQQLSDLLFSNFSDFIETINNSILTSDYNYLPVIPVAVIMNFFGKSRLVYILSILNIYCIPSVCFLRKAIMNLLASFSIKIDKELIFYNSVLFFTLPLFITFSGFVDVGGLIIIALVILLYFKETIPQIQKSFIIGLLLALLYLFRRWYMFWILSFIICAFIHTIVKSIHQNRKLSIKDAISKIGAILIVPITFGGILTLLFQPLVVNKLLLSNYSSMYSAYNFGVSKDFSQILRYFGAIVPILALISLTVSIFIKKIRVEAIFFASQVVICFVMFTRVQTHGPQHYLMYIPGIMALIAYLASIAGILKKKILAWGLIFVIGIMGFSNFAQSFFYTRNINSPFIDTIINKGLFATQKIIPNKRKDIKELQELINLLDQLSQDGNSKVAVLASSFTLNVDILNNFEMSLGVPERNWKKRPYLITGTTVDQRSSTPFWIFQCDYVLLGDPPLYHLNPEDQMVVVLPTKDIIESTGFGKAFKKLDYSFTLENGSTIYIYKRIRNVSQNEAQNMADQFHNLYPDLPKQYPAIAPDMGK